MTAILMIANFFSWFATTRVGQIVGLVALALGALATIWFKAKAAGRAEEREKNKKETDIFIANKEKLDADVADDSDADLTDRMRPWLRKRGG